MTNLLEETREVMELHDQQPEDITFIGSDSTSEEGLRYHTTWDKFIVMADREYNAGYGGTFVALDLIIEFKDGSRMYRSEYDGSEGWVFSSPCVTPATETLIEMESPFAFCYDSIDEAHREGYWNEEYHKDCLCPQDGCNNLKDSWDDMCRVCYAPIRAKEEEERRKNSPFLRIIHTPNMMKIDAEAMADKMKQAMTAAEAELVDRVRWIEDDEWNSVLDDSTRLACNNTIFQPFIDAVEAMNQGICDDGIECLQNKEVYLNDEGRCGACQEQRDYEDDKYPKEE